MDSLRTQSPVLFAAQQKGTSQARITVLLDAALKQCNELNPEVDLTKLSNHGFNIKGDLIVHPQYPDFGVKVLPSHALKNDLQRLEKRVSMRNAIHDVIVKFELRHVSVPGKALVNGGRNSPTAPKALIVDKLPIVRSTEENVKRYKNLTSEKAAEFALVLMLTGVKDVSAVCNSPFLDNADEVIAIIDTEYSALLYNGFESKPDNWMDKGAQLRSLIGQFQNEYDEFLKNLSPSVANDLKNPEDILKFLSSLVKIKVEPKRDFPLLCMQEELKKLQNDI